MSKTNSSYNMQAAQMGAADVAAGDTGTATGTTGTTLTDSGKSWTSNQWVGHFVASAGVIGVVISNTSTALTVDRWSAPATPGGSVGSTPGNVSYVILPGNAPAFFMALSADSGAVIATDVALPSEITTAGGGLIRKACTVGHAANATSYTEAATFTVNGSDSIPVTIAKMGLFQTVKGATGNSQFQTLVSPTATLSVVGDQLTPTDTISM